MNRELYEMSDEEILRELCISIRQMGRSFARGNTPELADCTQKEFREHQYMIIDSIVEMALERLGENR